jgi:hypothetical protein
MAVESSFVESTVAISVFLLAACLQAASSRPSIRMTINFFIIRVRVAVDHQDVKKAGQKEMATC